MTLNTHIKMSTYLQFLKFFTLNMFVTFKDWHRNNQHDAVFEAKGMIF
jgi:hypothetical protein